MSQNRRETRRNKSNGKFPPGWDAERVERVLAHYDELSQEEQVAEDEAAAAGESSGQTFISVPTDLLPAIRELLAAHENV